MNAGGTPRRVSLVANTSSRTGAQAFPEALRTLEDLGLQPDPHPLPDPSRLVDTVREVLDDGCDLLVLGGGDGTVSSVVDVLAGRRVVLGLLPFGTANDFARTLGVPTDLQQACTTIAGGKIVDVDVGLAGDNHYVNVASVGLAAGVTHALSPRLKKYAGPLAYPLATARAFAEHRPFSARLRFPDGDHDPVDTDRLLQVAVGNGRFYGGGNVVAPESGIDDRTLDVYTIQHGRWHDLVNVAYHFKSGGFVRTGTADHYRTARVTLETQPSLAINLDGELELHTPQTFTVDPNALHVVLPQESTAASAEHPAP